jgi:hypothetical protein
MDRIEKMRGAGFKHRKLFFADGGILLPIACAAVFSIGAGMLNAQVATSAKAYIGIWKMTAQDKRVGTLELMNYKGQLTGSITNAHATMDNNGKLVQFDAIPGAAPVVQASLSQGMLLINTEQTDEAIVPWNMTLMGEGKGTLQLAVKGHEMTFQITRVSWEENEQSSETDK